MAETPTHDPAPEDWPEDFAHENGDYLNFCHHCKRPFRGHKRRVTCKLCAARPSRSGRPAEADDPHPEYGPCDGFGVSGECSQCTGQIARRDGSVVDLDGRVVAGRPAGTPSAETEELRDALERFAQARHSITLRDRQICPTSTADAVALIEARDAVVALFDQLRTALAASREDRNTLRRRLALALMELGHVPDPRAQAEGMPIREIVSRPRHFRAPARDLTDAEVDAALASSDNPPVSDA